MIVTISQILIFMLSIAICVLSAWGIFAPDRLLNLVKEVMNQGWSIYFAVMVRLLFGLALIIVASYSKFPLIFQGLGWIALTAAVVIVLLGRERMFKLLTWTEQFSRTTIRIWLLFGIAFGVFLIFGIS